MQEYAYISSFHNAVIGDLGRFNCEGFTGRGTSKGQPLGCRPMTQLGGKQVRILLDQIRSVDKVRLGKRMGTIKKGVWYPVLLEMFE